MRRAGACKRSDPRSLLRGDIALSNHFRVPVDLAPEMRAKLFGRAADSRQRLLLEQCANRGRLQRLLERAIGSGRAAPRRACRRTTGRPARVSPAGPDAL